MESNSFGLSLLQNYSDDLSDSESVDDTNNHADNIPGQMTDGKNITQVTEDEQKATAISVDSSESMPPPLEFPHFYREPVESSSDSESSSDESCVTDVTLPLEVHAVSGDEDENDYGKRNAINGKTKMLEDLGILDLAPLEDLKISVPEEECIPLGVVHNIIDPLVIVSARKGCPAIDLDTVLFLDHGKTFLGQVFDVFGQVSEPMYMIRFNSMQHIIDQGVKVGMEVYFAPRTRHTAYVFVDALFKQKGSDASWENDQEPPEGCLDYSDDEQERKAKAAHRMKRNPRIQLDGESENPPKKRPSKFRRGQNRYQEHLIQQAAVNPFYMLPSSGYPTTNPPTGQNNSNNSSTLTNQSSYTTERAPPPSPYVFPNYPPPQPSDPNPLPQLRDPVPPPQLSDPNPPSQLSGPNPAQHHSEPNPAQNSANPPEFT